MRYKGKKPEAANLFRPENWAVKVYEPDILDNPEKLYRKPGYTPFE